MAAPTIGTVTASTSATTKYEKVELNFTVTTVATRLYWPYDTPSNGVTSGVGVSVDALFSTDGFVTTVTVPCFYYQPYVYTPAKNSTGFDHIVLDGTPYWKARWTPDRDGVWEYKIRAQDSGGTTTTTVQGTVTVSGVATKKGFPRVAANDHRYFEIDGQILHLFGSSNPTSDHVVSAAADYAAYHTNKVNFNRPWWNGAQGPWLWGYCGNGYASGQQGWSMGNEHPCETNCPTGYMLIAAQSGNTWGGDGGIPVKPSTTYRVGVWIKTSGVTGPSNANWDDGAGHVGSYGANFRCFDNDSSHTPMSWNMDWVRPTNWTWYSWSLTTAAGATQIDYFDMGIKNETAGTAYFYGWAIQEDLGGGNYGPNIFPLQRFDPWMEANQFTGAVADEILTLCESEDVYLKPVLHSIFDTPRKRIASNFTMTTQGNASEDNVLFDPAGDHAQYTLYKYFWRYLIARFGWSQRILAWEFFNEVGMTENHCKLVNAMADYMWDNDPNKHYVVTSFYHSYFPKECWGNASYPELRIQDWHQYIGSTPDAFPLQLYYGWWISTTLFAEPACNYADCLDESVKYNGARSIKFTTGSGALKAIEGYPFTVKPSTNYTLKYYQKGDSLVKVTYSPTAYVEEKSGWWGDQIAFRTCFDADHGHWGTYDWEEKTYSFTTGSTTTYLKIWASNGYANGSYWIDNIRLYDEDADEYVEVPNGDFDSDKLHHDTANIAHSIGNMVGHSGRRMVDKPLIRGEYGLVDPQSQTDPYHGVGYSGETQELLDDTNGIWYKKLIWGHLDPGGVIDCYWWEDAIDHNSIWGFATAYQTFMANITDLNNGLYAELKHSSTNGNLRVFGQKDTTNKKAHFWIDNKTYTWYNVVVAASGYSNQSGTISFAMPNGNYKLKRYSTTTGALLTTTNVNVTDGTYSQTVTDLVSDDLYTLTFDAQTTVYRSTYGTGDAAIHLHGAIASSQTAGRQSEVVTNATNLFTDAIVTVNATTGSSGIGNDKALYIYAYDLTGGTTYPEGITGTEGAYTFTLPTNLKLAAIIRYSANSQTRGTSFSMAKVFGGILPQKWGLAVRNYTGTTLADFTSIYQGYNATNNTIPPPGAAPYSVWIEKSGVWIKKDHSSSPLVEETFICAKREKVAFQICLRGSAAATGLDITKSNLVKGGDTISSSNVSIYRTDYVTVTGYGDYPDIMIPWTDGQTLNANDTKVIWVVVDVPYDAVAGNYTGTIQIQDDDASSTTVTYHLSVYNFVLPASPELACAFRMADWSHTAKILDGSTYRGGYDVVADSDAHKNLNEQLMEQAYAWNLGIVESPQRQQADYTEHEVGEWLDLNGCTAYHGATWTNACADYFCDTLGHSSKVYWLTYDEPSYTGLYDTVMGYVTTLHGYNASARALVTIPSYCSNYGLTAWASGQNYVVGDIRGHNMYDAPEGYNIGKAYKCIQNHLSSASTEPDIGASWQLEWIPMAFTDYAGAGNHDIVCWSSDFVPYIGTPIDNVIAAGKQNWAYIFYGIAHKTSGKYTAALYSPLRHRLQPWTLYNYKCTGMYSWNCCEWSDTDGKVWEYGGTWYMDNSPWAFGEGMLWYPGGKYGVTNAFLPSVRALHLSMGVCDYGWIKAVETKANRATAMTYVDDMVTNFFTFTDSMDTFDTTRQAMADYIVS